MLGCKIAYSCFLLPVMIIKTRTRSASNLSKFLYFKKERTTNHTISFFHLSFRVSSAKILWVFSIQCQTIASLVEGLDGDSGLALVHVLIDSCSSGKKIKVKQRFRTLFIERTLFYIRLNLSKIAQSLTGLCTKPRRNYTQMKTKLAFHTYIEKIVLQIPPTVSMRIPDIPTRSIIILTAEFRR